MSRLCRLSGVARLALRLAFGNRREQVWRRLSLTLAGVICAGTLMAGLATAALIGNTQAREAARTGVAADATASPLMVATRADVWEGEQFPLIYLEPTGVDPAGMTLPPGVTQMPAPGGIVVSPALARLAAQNPGLAGRYPVGSAVIGPEGLITRDELLAYVRPAEGQTLKNTEATRYVAAFGMEPNTYGAVSVGFPVSLPTTQMVLTGILLLGIPALLMLCASTATASTVRDRRLQLLNWLGTSSMQLILISVVDAAIWVGIGAGTAAFGGYYMLPYLTTAPVIDLPVFAGDLRVSAANAVAVACVVTALAGVSAMLTDRWRRRMGTSRPVVAADKLSRWRSAPMGAGLILILIALLSPGQLSGILGLGGAILVVLALPLLMPHWISGTGTFLRQRGGTSMLLAGRRLERFPTIAARPLFGLGALAVTACGVAGYLAVGSVPERSVSPARETYWVSSLDEQPDSIRDFRNSIPEAVALQYAQTEKGVLVAASCVDVAQRLSVECGDDGISLQGQADADRLRALMGIPPMEPVELVKTLPVPSSRLVVLPGHSYTADDVRNKAFRTLLGPVVQSSSDGQMHQSPLMAWLAAAFSVAGMLTVIAAVILAIDGAIRSAKRDASLRNIGLTARGLARLEAVQFIASYTTVMVASMAVGVGLCYAVATIGAAPAFPWLDLLIIAAVIAFFGAIITATISGAGRRVATLRPVE